MTKDQKQFFKDFGAALQQTVEQIRGVEENYFSWFEKSSSAFPWLVDVNKKLQAYAEQDLTTALDFSHKLKDVKNLHDLVKVQTEFMQTQMNVIADRAKELGRSYLKAEANAAKNPLDGPC